MSKGSQVLVLTRRVDESVVLRLADGRRLTVTVVEASHTRAKLAFGLLETPDVQVLRSELDK